MSILRPSEPGAAFDRFLAQRVPTAERARRWTPADGPMPSIYVSHGAPPVFDDAHWIDQLFSWSQAMPKPTAIVVVSAHWEEAPMAISASGPATPLVYDFGGFASRYYSMTYPTPDAGALSNRIEATMRDGGAVHRHRTRGLDHGAWVPLKVMYPEADIPVVQISIPTDDPDRLMDIGRRLRPLREEGVLIVGSGFMTHGLAFATYEMMAENLVPGWSRDFDGWVADAIGRGDLEALANYRSAPGMPYAHPTVDHYIPLFVTLGAATDPESVPHTPIDDFQFGFAKRSLQYT